jgi:hypothetical protein
MPAPAFFLVAGAAYQSATAFEKQTDNKQPHTRLDNFYQRELRTRQVEVPSRELAAPVIKWARDQLTAAGVGVVPQEVKPRSKRSKPQSDPAVDDTPPQV